MERPLGRLRGGDDTALNSIKLMCSYHIPGFPEDLEAGVITSLEGPFGNWFGESICPGQGNFMKGAQFQSEPNQGGNHDDTAGNSLNMECYDGTILEGDSPDHWGSWSTWVFCPENTAVCGLKNLVEPNIFKDGDDTAHNAVVFYCCEMSA